MARMLLELNFSYTLYPHLYYKSPYHFLLLDVADH